MEKKRGSDSAHKNTCALRNVRIKCTPVWLLWHNWTYNVLYGILPDNVLEKVPQSLKNSLIVWSLFRKKISSSTCRWLSSSKKLTWVLLASLIMSILRHAIGISILFNWINNNNNKNKVQLSNLQTEQLCCKSSVSITPSQYLPFQLVSQKQFQPVQTCHQMLPKASGQLTFLVFHQLSHSWAELIHHTEHEEL